MPVALSYTSSSGDTGKAITQAPHTSPRVGAKGQLHSWSGSERWCCSNEDVSDLSSHSRHQPLGSRVAVVRYAKLGDCNLFLRDANPVAVIHIGSSPHPPHPCPFALSCLKHDRWFLSCWIFVGLAWHRHMPSTQRVLVDGS